MLPNKIINYACPYELNVLNRNPQQPNKIAGDPEVYGYSANYQSLPFWAFSAIYLIILFIISILDKWEQ